MDSTKLHKLTNEELDALYHDTIGYKPISEAREDAIRVLKNHVPFLRYVLACMAKGERTANTTLIGRTHDKYERYCRTYGLDYKTPPEEHILDLTYTHYDTTRYESTDHTRRLYAPSEPTHDCPDGCDVWELYALSPDGEETLLKSSVNLLNII